MIKNNICLSVSSILGVVSLVTATSASALVTTYSWTGLATYLDSQGAPLQNGSIIGKGANRFQTPVTGTMSFDDVTGAGVGAVYAYEFFNGTLPAEAVGMSLQAVGDGAGGPGTLVVGNMLHNWDGKNGSPLSMVWDAAGFLNASATDWADNVLDQADVAAYGAVPASDGAYTDQLWGYLNLGPVPMAVMEINTSNAMGCVLGVDNNYSNNNGGGCMNHATSGVLPLVTDTAVNGAEYLMGDGVGVAGSPMQDGPFKEFSIAYEIMTMTQVSQVPVPAAIWLFGSGLLGLVGVARSKKSAV